MRLKCRALEPESLLIEYFPLPKAPCHLAIGGWTLRIDRKRPEFEETLPSTYQRFLRERAEPELVVETIPDRILEKREGPILFDHRPLWRLSGELYGRRW